VPQGGPLSPLVFLLVAEALTRLIEDDPEIVGIDIGTVVIKITQFADDTLLFLRSFQVLARVWKVLDMYQEATAMKANASKFEALRAGALKRAPIPNDLLLKATTINFPKVGEYVRLLGIPFWEDGKYDVDRFFEALYLKCKVKIAAWRDHALLTLFGKSMLANSMVFSRFRYWAQVMPLPAWLNAALEEDTQALIWAKEVDFDPDEVGTSATYKRCMLREAQYNPKCSMLGIGTIHWAAHIKAIQVNWLHKYLDGTQGAWKLALDAWYGRFHEGRGVVLTRTPMSELNSSIKPGMLSGIPKFFRLALAHIRELELVPLSPETLSTDSARAHPIFTSPLFRLPPVCVKYVAIWRNVMTLNRVQDTFKIESIDGSVGEYTDGELTRYFYDRCRTYGANIIVNDRDRSLIPISTMVKNWHSILKAIPRWIVRAAKGEDH